jgi:UDPglucose--hexose-1-phosphate uridylyltransferase
VIRRNPITGDPVLLVPERALRPHAFDGDDEEIVCPFCPGNERETPPEIWRDGYPWSIRVVPNKYPASDRHEIVVETADHAARFEDLLAEHAARVVDAWLARYRALLAHGPTVIFKNDGPAAGASLAHAHSQILGTPFVPPRLAREAEAFARAARCPLCDVDDEPLVRGSEHYRVIAPRGSALAYEHWIVPREHGCDVDAPHELASLLQSAARASRAVAPAFNWLFVTFPREPRAHWYVAVLPRLAGLAGYEAGAGGAINIVDPDEAARTLRQRQ